MYIVSTSCGVEKEPLKTAFGFKGNALTCLWQIAARMESEKNNLLPFNQDIITLSAEGPIEIIGPKTISLRGGMGGTYVKTTGEAGEAKLVAQAEGLEPIEIEFTIA